MYLLLLVSHCHSNKTQTAQMFQHCGNWVTIKGFLKSCWWWIFTIGNPVICILSCKLELCDCIEDSIASEIDDMRETLSKGTDQLFYSITSTTKSVHTWCAIKFNTFLSQELHQVEKKCIIISSIVKCDPPNLCRSHVSKHCTMVGQYITFSVILIWSVMNKNAEARCLASCQPGTHWMSIRSALSLSTSLDPSAVSVVMPSIQWLVTAMCSIWFGSVQRCIVLEISPKDPCS